MNGRSDRDQNLGERGDADAEESKAEARRHFERTGSYRAEDVISVLGDPREHVEIKSSRGMRIASWLGDG